MTQLSLFENQRMTFAEAVQTSIDSLNAYGANYRHWVVAYSGGKDSSATAAFVSWAIKNGHVTAPESLTVLYADTRQELQPLWAVAQKFMDALRADGFNAQTVLPAMDERFYVYMLGRGVPPPTNRFRWCTEKLKITPMDRALMEIASNREDERLSKRHKLIEAAKECIARHYWDGAALCRDYLKETRPTRDKFLGLTGVRMGESAARDARIAISCSKDSGECGQGWMQVNPPDAISDTLAPLLHWRLCYVWDWLYFGADAAYAKTAAWKDYQHGYSGLAEIAEVYGSDDARTGCAGCNLASRDTALENLVKTPKWAHLAPLLELKPLFRELKKAKWRLRKSGSEKRKDGQYSKNAQRMGPITMEGRAYGLERVLDIQARARVDLINPVEEARIRELWSLNTWPDGWDGTEIHANVPVDSVQSLGYSLIVQPLLIGKETS